MNIQRALHRGVSAHLLIGPNEISKAARYIDEARSQILYVASGNLKIELRDRSRDPNRPDSLGVEFPHDLHLQDDDAGMLEREAVRIDTIAMNV